MRVTQPRRILIVGALSAFVAACDTQRSLSPRQRATAAALKSAVNASTVSMVGLGDLGGGLSIAHGINDIGVIVGESHTAAGDNHAFSLADGVITDLAPSMAFSVALAISRGGIIAGAVGESQQSYHAALWIGGIQVDLGTLPGDDRSIAWGINASGQAVGISQDGLLKRHAVLYQNSVVIPLPTLGGEQSVALSINDAGDIVGGAQTAAGTFHAVQWHNFAPIDMGLLPGDISSIASGINRNGLIVGSSTGPGGISRAVEWTSGVISQLPSLNAEYSEVARQINEVGQVVGTSTSPDQTVSFPVLWENGAPVELGRLPGFEQADANSINSLGIIVGVVGTSSIPFQAEAIAWVPPSTLDIRGAGALHGPVTRHGPPANPPGKGTPPQKILCSASIGAIPADIPIDWWEDGFGVNLNFCLPDSLDPQAPNEISILNLGALKVGATVRVCGRLTGDADDNITMAAFFGDRVNGEDNPEFIRHTPGQTWQIVQPHGLRAAPSILFPNDRCNISYGLFRFWSLGAEHDIKRVQ